VELLSHGILFAVKPLSASSADGSAGVGLMAIAVALRVMASAVKAWRNGFENDCPRTWWLLLT
jgi:hypothetical protein